MTTVPEITRITLASGHKVTGYSYGDGAEAVMLANGGPGLPSLYLRDPHARLTDAGYRVVTWDQLGCGASDRPEDPALWTLERYVEEAEAVRAAFDVERVHFLGHSWGTWLGTEYALTHPDRIASLILADGACDIPHLVDELKRLKLGLGHETVTMMAAHEAADTMDHPEYQAAITILNYRHVCRLKDWPAPLTQALADWNMGPYHTMQGPNEFTFTGNMTDWNRIPAMHRITAPALVLTGAHDELTPACSEKMHRAMPDSRIHVFPNSSHMPFYEEPDAYFAVLTGFLGQVTGRR